MNAEEKRDFEEWKPSAWQWLAPCGVLFIISTYADFVDTKEVELMALYANGSFQGKFSSFEKAKDRAREICGGVVK